MTPTPRKTNRSPAQEPNTGALPWAWTDSMSHGVIAIDAQGTVMAINASARRFFGLKKHDPLPLHVASLISLLDGETRTKIHLPKPADLRPSSSPLFFYKAVCLTSNGEEKTVNASFSALRRDDSGAANALLVFQDISEENARECLSKNRKEMEVIGMMAQNIANDFGHWVSVISGHAARITENLLPNTRAHEEALGVLAAAENANDIVKRLMGMTTVASNPARDIKIENINLGETIGNAITLCRDMRPAAGVSFKIRNLKLMTYAVRADSTLLLDCLTHLFNSATETMPNGGTISLGAVRNLHKDPPHLILRVQDQSEGLHLPNADAFAAIQADAEKWGGTLRVQKKPGKGLVYRLTMPLAETADADERTPRQQAQPHETLLLADDDETERLELGGMLESEGYTVITARDGDECLDLYRKHSGTIGLSIVDFLMPGKETRQILRAILASDPTAAIIVTSGFSRDYVRGQLEQGAWGFIKKPIDSNQCLELIRQTLDRKEQHENASRKRLFQGKKPSQPMG